MEADGGKKHFKKMKKNEIKNTAAYLTLSDRFICAGRDELWEKRLGGGGGGVAASHFGMDGYRGRISKCNGLQWRD